MYTQLARMAVKQSKRKNVHGDQSVSHCARALSVLNTESESMAGWPDVVCGSVGGCVASSHAGRCGCDMTTRERRVCVPHGRHALHSRYVPNVCGAGAAAATHIRLALLLDLLPLLLHLRH